MGQQVAATESRPRLDWRGTVGQRSNTRAKDFQDAPYIPETDIYISHKPANFTGVFGRNLLFVYTSRNVLKKSFNDGWHISCRHINSERVLKADASLNSVI